MTTTAKRWHGDDNDDDDDNYDNDNDNDNSDDNADSNNNDNAAADDDLYNAVDLKNGKIVSASLNYSYLRWFCYFPT